MTIGSLPSNLSACFSPSRHFLKPQRVLFLTFDSWSPLDNWSACGSFAWHRKTASDMYICLYSLLSQTSQFSLASCLAFKCTPLAVRGWHGNSEVWRVFISSHSSTAAVSAKHHIPTCCLPAVNSCGGMWKLEGWRLACGHLALGFCFASVWTAASNRKAGGSV